MLNECLLLDLSALARLTDCLVCLACLTECLAFVSRAEGLRHVFNIFPEKGKSSAVNNKSVLNYYVSCSVSLFVPRSVSSALWLHISLGVGLGLSVSLKKGEARSGRKIVNQSIFRFVSHTLSCSLAQGDSPSPAGNWVQFWVW
jgi:hypothetical protein